MGMMDLILKAKKHFLEALLCHDLKVTQNHNLTVNFK